MVDIFSRITNNRFTAIGLGHLLYAGFNWVFDHVIYVYVVYTWGMLIGGGLMTLGSLIQCAFTLRFYEKMQIDWVGAGALHTWYKQQSTSFSGRLYGRIKDNQKAVFLLLCVFSDPFITTAYFREGRFNGLTSLDWRIFFCSVFVSNFYWICVSVLVGNGIAGLWHFYLLR
ncbi:MAG: hypothetical protein ABL903_04690 [Methylococcales bacterium]